MREGARKRAFGQALSAMATVAVVTSCASSGSQPGTQAAPIHPATSVASTTTASTPHEFVSTRYGFAVTLPQDWSEVDADFAWDGKGLQSPGSPFFANFTSPTSTRTLMAASVAVPRRTQLAAWQEAMVRGHLSSCSAPLYAPVKTTLGGEPSTMSAFGRE